VSRALDVLVLHGIGEMASARKTLVDFVTSFERFAPEHRYVYHDNDRAVTRALRRMRFDVILLDSTFLDSRAVRPIEIYEGIRRRYEFVRTSDAVKIALPQDEYDNGGLLDDWLADWRVDLVSSCGVHDHWDVVYPRTRAIAELRRGITGFFDPARAATMRAAARPLADRPIDLGYRVFRLGPEFGRFGQQKARLADEMVRALAGSTLRADISTEVSKMIFGDGWWRFLGDSRFTLGSESGSSVWDPRGEIRRRVRAYAAAHPEAGFDEVEAACLGGDAQRYTFRMISPRVFEATSAMSSQILLRGGYLGLIQPGTHYLAVDADFGNLAEVIAATADLDAAQRRAEACFETFTYSPQVHYPTFVRDLITYAEQAVAARKLTPMPAAELAALKAEHERGTWSEAVITRGLGLAQRLSFVKRLVPRGVQARILARLGRRVGLKD